MREFIKIRNDTNAGEMLLRVAFIQSVSDREGGGATVVYGEGPYTECAHFRTASTAAEVLGAIEGVDDSPAPTYLQGADSAWIDLHS